MIWTALAWMGSKVGRYVTGALLMLAFVFGLRATARRDGRHDAIEEMKDADRREADALRRRVDVARRMHPDDSVGFRD